MFLRLQTQWLFAGMGSIVGLNYQSIEFLFKLYKVKNPRRMLADLREIETGVLEAMSRSREKDAKR